MVRDWGTNQFISEYLCTCAYTCTYIHIYIYIHTHMYITVLPEIGVPLHIMPQNTIGLGTASRLGLPFRVLEVLGGCFGIC